MRYPIIRIAITLLTLSLGIIAGRVWKNRRSIIDACVETARDYQD